MRDLERGRDTGRGRSRLSCGEPDVEVDPRAPGSCPELKADTQLLSHPGVPEGSFLRPAAALVSALALGLSALGARASGEEEGQVEAPEDRVAPPPPPALAICEGPRGPRGGSGGGWSLGVMGGGQQ